MNFRRLMSRYSRNFHSQTRYHSMNSLRSTIPPTRFHSPKTNHHSTSFPPTRSHYSNSRYHLTNSRPMSHPTTRFPTRFRIHCPPPARSGLPQSREPRFEGSRFRTRLQKLHTRGKARERQRRLG